MFNLIMKFLVFLFISSSVFLFVYTINLFLLLILSVFDKRKTKPENTNLTDLPMVTVQLPIFNEKYVASRIIERTTKIDYPRKKLEIQVLDDSTDDTLQISRQMVKKYQSSGFNIKLLHRTERTGQKAGALKYGLETAEGEFIAIYDADFIPNKNILKKVIPYFLKEPKLGMVQTRWGFTNPGYSGLTKSQSLFIDIHFLIEQVARNRNGLFMNFNGTAGVWRKNCIIDAGNWKADTLTEDIDLSYRALLKSWKMKYLKHIVNDSELPVTINAYKSQQFRWAKGSIQTAKKLLGKIWGAKIPLFTKFQAFIHLTYYAVHTILLINLILLVLLISKGSMYYFYYNFLGPFIYLFIFTSFIPIISSAVTIIRNYKNNLSRLTWIPYAMVIGTSLAVNNTWAVIEALLGKKTPFIRTPKYGVSTPKYGINKKDMNKQNKFIPKLNLRNKISLIIEIFFTFYAFSGMFLSFWHKNYLIIPYLLIYTMSFGYVSIATINSIRIDHKKTSLEYEAN